jgi:hypothetical protein
VLDHLHDRKKFNISFDKLDRLMQNIGRSQFTFDVFKVAYDSDPRLQELVADFDQDQITLKNSETDDLPQGRDNTDSVEKMAKRAVDL